MSWIASQTDSAAEELRQVLASPQASHVRDYAGADPDFGCWLLACEQHCRLNYRVSIFDLPDIAWRDLYDDESTPVEAVRESTIEL